jgi:hypothetical protein
MSQNTLVDPTTGTLSGLALVQNLNAALDTLNTIASGASAPSSPEAGQLWHDTGTETLWMRDDANTTWISVGTLNQATKTFTAALASLAATATTAAGLSTTLAIAGGGTGATNQAAALANILGSSVIAPANGGTGATSLSSLFPSYFGAAGSQKLPNGFLLNWTSGAVTAGTGAYLGFYATFPNACLHAQATLYESSGVSNGAASVGSFATNAAYVVNQSSATCPVLLLALGY